MVKISYGSLAPHNAQILTGFNLLTKGRCEISSKADLSLPSCIVVADFGNKKIAYDTSDGYFGAGAICTDKRYEFLSERIETIYKRDYTSHVCSSELLFRGGG